MLNCSLKYNVLIKNIKIDLIKMDFFCKRFLLLIIVLLPFVCNKAKCLDNISEEKSNLKMNDVPESYNELKEISIVKWYGNSESAFALTFDDGFKAHYDYVFPILNKYGLRATFYVNSSFLVSKVGGKAINRYGYIEDFCEMSDAGNEIASHSLTHPNLSELSSDKLIAELYEDKNNIEKFTGRKCLTHAYPYCNHNKHVDDVASSCFIACRQCGSIRNNYSVEYQKRFSINSKMLIWKYPRSLLNEKQSFLELKDEIDKISGGFGVVCMHETLPFSLLNTSDTYEIATTEFLERLCCYLSVQWKTRRIWTAPFSDVLRYSIERDALQVRKNVISEDCIRYDFFSNLDSAVYNVPLTIGYTVESRYKKYYCIIKTQNNKIIRKIPLAGKKQLYLDIVPNRDIMLIVKF